MSPTWRPEDKRALIEARRTQVVLAEVTSHLTTITHELNDLLSEINTEDEDEEGDDG